MLFTMKPVECTWQPTHEVERMVFHEGRLKDLPGSLAGNNGRGLKDRIRCVCVDGRKEEVKNPFQCVRNFASGIYIRALCLTSKIQAVKSRRLSLAEKR